MRNKHTTHKNIDKHSRKGTRKRMKDSGNSRDGVSSQYSRASSGTIGSKVKSHKRIPKAISRGKSRKNVGVFRGGDDITTDEKTEIQKIIDKVNNSTYLNTDDKNLISNMENKLTTMSAKEVSANKDNIDVFHILTQIKKTRYYYSSFIIDKNANYGYDEKKIPDLLHKTKDNTDNLGDIFDKLEIYPNPPAYKSKKPSFKRNTYDSNFKPHSSKVSTRLTETVSENRNNNPELFENIEQEYEYRDVNNTNGYSNHRSTPNPSFDVPNFTYVPKFNLDDKDVNQPLTRDDVNIPENITNHRIATSSTQENIITPDKDTSSTSKDIITPDNDTSSTLEDRVISLSEVEKYIQQKIEDTNNSIAKYKLLNGRTWFNIDSIRNIVDNLNDKLYELQKLKENIKNIVKLENKETKLKEKLEDKYTEELNSLRTKTMGN